MSKRILAHLRRLTLVTGALALGACADGGGMLPELRRDPENVKLLVCPTMETSVASGLMDPILGGLLTAAGTTVSVPPRAVTVPTLMVLTVPASIYVEIDVTVPGVESFLFNRPITVSIDYSRCQQSILENRELMVWHLDPLTHSPLEDMQATDNRPARKITFETGHLSGYAIAY